MEITITRITTLGGLIFLVGCSAVTGRHTDLESQVETDKFINNPSNGTRNVAANIAGKSSSQETMALVKQQKVQSEELNPPPTDVVVAARILQRGIIRTGKVKEATALDDPTGRHLTVKTSSVFLETDTSRIPARIGISFGCFCEVSGLKKKFGDNAEVETVWTYPVMLKPDGSISRGFSFPDLSTANLDGKGRGWSGYRFEKDFELVPGEWRLELRYQGRTLATQVFTVYRE